jgi:hypothetical protein
MDILKPVKDIITGGLTLESVWLLVLAILVFMIVIAIQGRARKYVAYKWVKGNPRMGIGAWLRFGTSTGYIDGVIEEITPRNVVTRLWDEQKAEFVAYRDDPILAFAGATRVILDTMPKGAAVKLAGQRATDNGFKREG